MKLTKRKKIILGAVAGLVLVEVVTYWLFAEQSMPVAAIRQLYDYRTRSFSFILVPRRAWDSLTQGQKSALRRALARHSPVICFSEADVPQECKQIIPLTGERRRRYEERLRSGLESPEEAAYIQECLSLGYSVSAYHNGIRVEWALDRRGPFWMVGRAHCYLADLGAEWRRDVYIWLFGWWVRVRNLDHAKA
ncbi:MAG: hypothetical protein FJ290_24035 [Planctomycetes bacterium]|nr:hypothetical protein [Planctomycetota bacterium]